MLGSVRTWLKKEDHPRSTRKSGRPKQSHWRESCLGINIAKIKEHLTGLAENVLLPDLYDVDSQTECLECDCAPHRGPTPSPTNPTAAVEPPHSQSVPLPRCASEAMNCLLVVMVALFVLQRTA
ncbi:hypothetical protein J6590_067887 [Homalodisca vitripennis]|nr:hypothetical protein J6590_067887 [Homalodisca vitripennis]